MSEYLDQLDDSLRARRPGRLSFGNAPNTLIESGSSEADTLSRLEMLICDSCQIAIWRPISTTESAGRRK
jgi:hypothetical protein